MWSTLEVQQAPGDKRQNLHCSAVDRGPEACLPRSRKVHSRTNTAGVEGRKEPTLLIGRAALGLHLDIPFSTREANEPALSLADGVEQP